MRAPSLRRLTVLAALAALLAPGRLSAQAAGCFLSARGAGPVGWPRLVATTGYPVIDQQLNAIGNLASAAFGVRPFYAGYDDRESPNAFATARPLNPLFPDGTVLIGMRLLAREVGRVGATRSRPTYTVAAIVAHEFAHVLQHRQGTRLPTVQLELMADYLSGWFMAGASRLDPMTNLGDGMEVFYRMGDYAFNDEDHHGTPAERRAAFMQGVVAGARGAPLARAYAAAEAYVRQSAGRAGFGVGE